MSYPEGGKKLNYVAGTCGGALIGGVLGSLPGAAVGAVVGAVVAYLAHKAKRG